MRLDAAVFAEEPAVVLSEFDSFIFVLEILSRFFLFCAL